MDGDLIRRLEWHRSYSGHLQIAAVPIRAEPNQEANLQRILETLEAIGYRESIDLEYKPRART